VIERGKWHDDETHCFNIDIISGDTFY